MTTQEWIDRYVAEVGRMLPERNRADVEKEIRSLLQDAAAERRRPRRRIGGVRHPRQLATRHGHAATAQPIPDRPAALPVFGTVQRAVDGFEVVGGIVGSVLQPPPGVDPGLARCRNVSTWRVEVEKPAVEPRVLAPGRGLRPRQHLRDHLNRGLHQYLRALP